MSVRTKIAVGTAGVAAAAATIFGIATPAHAAYTTYISVQKRTPADGTKVLDIANYSLADKGVATLYSLRTSGEVRNQRWSVEQVGTVNGHRIVQLRNALSGKCLDKSQDTPNANGNAVYQYTCSGASNQQWEAMGPSGYVQLRSVAGQRCLDVTGPSYTDGARLHVWDCYSTWSQRWNIDQ